MIYSSYWTSWIEREIDGQKERALEDNVQHVSAATAINEKKREKEYKGYDSSWKVKIKKHEYLE